MRWAVLLFLISSSAAFAGTGQIFSPSGLPQSSTQTYTPPTPGNTPTVSFPTPPLPLGDAILQSFPASALPLNNGGAQNPAATGSGVTQQSLLPINETNAVESFFQCNPAGNAPKAVPPAKKKNSPPGATRKFIWHALDNLGVPMVVGKDNDLDPSLNPNYVTLPPATPVKSTTHLIPQKIPESELEGTDVSTKNDQTLPLH